MIGSQYVAFVGLFSYIYVSFDICLTGRMDEIVITGAGMCAGLRYNRGSISFVGLFIYIYRFGLIYQV